MKVVMLQIAATENKDGTVTLFKASGERITTIKVEDLGRFDVCKVMWRDWAAECQSKLNGVKGVYLHPRGSWRRKAGVLVSSWHKRAKQTRFGANAKNDTKPNHGTWSESASWMMKSGTHAVKNFRRVSDNQFITWAATVSRNSNKRARACLNR